MLKNKSLPTKLDQPWLCMMNSNGSVSVTIWTLVGVECHHSAYNMEKVMLRFLDSFNCITIDQNSLNDISFERKFIHLHDAVQIILLLLFFYLFFFKLLYDKVSIFIIMLTSTYFSFLHFIMGLKNFGSLYIEQ